MSKPAFQPFACKGKVRCLDLGPGRENLAKVSLFPTDGPDAGEEIIGDVEKTSLPEELHQVGAVFTYEALDENTCRFTAVPVRELSAEELTALQKQSAALFEND